MVQSVGANLSPDQTFGSIRSLSVTREVASFPLSRTPTPPPQHRSVPFITMLHINVKMYFILSLSCKEFGVIKDFI